MDPSLCADRDSSSGIYAAISLINAFEFSREHRVAPRRGHADDTGHPGCKGLLPPSCRGDLTFQLNESVASSLNLCCSSELGCTTVQRTGSKLPLSLGYTAQPSRHPKGARSRRQARVYHCLVDCCTELDHNSYVRGRAEQILACTTSSYSILWAVLGQLARCSSSYSWQC